MSTPTIDYEAVIADLEAKKAQIDATINMLRALSGLGTLNISPPSGSPGGGGGTGRIAPDAFFGKSIPEAAVMHLTNARQKLSTQQLMDALESGGLPKSKYNTVYAILRRRENQVGDIINMQGEWGLAAWYPNHAKTKAASAKKGAASEADFEAEDQSEAEAEPEAATA